MLITDALNTLMLTEVLPSDLVPLWKAAQANPPQAELTPQMFALLDAEIIFQAESLGWRIMLSPLVHARLWAWEQNPAGYETAERFWNALQKQNRIIHHLQLPPVGRGQKENKEATVRELRGLLKILPLSVPTSKLVSEFKRQAAEQGCNNVIQNLDSWETFITQRPAEFRTSRRAPGSLYNAWLAWATGYRQEPLRKLITKL